MTFDEICTTAVAKWGVEAQLDQAVEEAAELIQAINKFKRYSSPWPLIEEMVDVEIMIGQLKAIVRDATGRSNNRMYNRIREEKLKKVEEKLK
jgi:NTP pyrophosphatase (non-canonical NTP hydrolase)